MNDIHFYTMCFQPQSPRMNVNVRWAGGFGSKDPQELGVAQIQ